MKGHLHIIGICGTAMAGIAALGKEMGWQVTGSDQGVYPPMSDFLQERGIVVAEGFSADNLHPSPTLVVVGNAISRGNEELEELLDRGLPYTSGAQWLYENVLQGRHPVIVTGTHGKTTTASMTAWLWENARQAPGFMIGGIPANFNVSARYPHGPWVVMEGDEYDTAFFDKRAKFQHYRPRTVILHNLEYDHADIYPDLEAIRQQFRLMLRLVPRAGLILANGDEAEVESLLDHAHGSRIVRYGIDGEHPFTARLERSDGSRWSLLREGEVRFTVEWNHLGNHNVMNGLAAAVAALSHGLDEDLVKEGLESFAGVARRMQFRFESRGISVYDDFAHHPTAVDTALSGMREHVGEQGRLWAILEPRSNTMRRRIHQARISQVLSHADRVLLARPAARGLASHELLDVERVVSELNGERSGSAAVLESAQEAAQLVATEGQSGDRVVVMSNGGFDNIFDKIQTALSETQE